MNRALAAAFLALASFGAYLTLSNANAASLDLSSWDTSCVQDKDSQIDGARLHSEETVKRLRDFMKSYEAAESKSRFSRNYANTDYVRQLFSSLFFEGTGRSDCHTNIRWSLAQLVTQLPDEDYTIHPLTPALAKLATSLDDMEFKKLLITRNMEIIKKATPENSESCRFLIFQTSEMLTSAGMNQSCDCPPEFERLKSMAPLFLDFVRLSPLGHLNRTAYVKSVISGFEGALVGLTRASATPEEKKLAREIYGQLQLEVAQVIDEYIQKKAQWPTTEFWSYDANVVTVGLQILGGFHCKMGQEPSGLQELIAKAAPLYRDFGGEVSLDLEIVKLRIQQCGAPGAPYWPVTSQAVRGY